MSPLQNKKRGSSLKGGKTWLALAIVIAVLASGSAFYVLQKVSATTTYYVLSKDVAARTQITPSMLSPVITSLGGQPRNALDVGSVSQTPTYSKFELHAGDVLSGSNTGPLTPINVGVPDNFVIASFQAPPENSVAGRIKRGDYVDIIGVSSDKAGSQTSKYVLRRVLVLDANSSLTQASSGTATTAAADPNASVADTAAARTGVPVLYTVALPPADAATLAVLHGDTLYVVLTSAADVKNGAGEADIVKNKTDAYMPGVVVGDSGVGTDQTFGNKGTPSATPTVAPSATPTVAPSATPTVAPSATPSATP